jgi:hypothetical protein
MYDLFDEALDGEGDYDAERFTELTRALDSFLAPFPHYLLEEYAVQVAERHGHALGDNRSRILRATKRLHTQYGRYLAQLREEQPDLWNAVMWEARALGHADRLDLRDGPRRGSSTSVSTHTGTTTVSFGRVKPRGG